MLIPSGFQKKCSSPRPPRLEARVTSAFHSSRHALPQPGNTQDLPIWPEFKDVRALRFDAAVRGDHREIGEHDALAMADVALAGHAHARHVVLRGGNVRQQVVAAL